MRVAVLSESPVDEVVIRAFMDAILGQKTESIDLHVRTRGWPAICDVLPSIIKRLHWHDDAEGLVLCVDTNGSEIHRSEHDDIPHRDCRMCQLRTLTHEILVGLSPRPDRPTALGIAIGTAVPAIEAWLLCGVDSGVGESQWQQKKDQDAQSRGYVRTLKKTLYGTDHASQIERKRISLKAVERLSVGNFRTLEDKFPGGFGSL